MAPSMCPDPCGTRWGSWFQAILYHISAHFCRTFGVYAVRMFLLKMPHKTDMPNCQVSRVHEVSPERGTVSTHHCCVDWWLCWWNHCYQLTMSTNTPPLTTTSRPLCQTTRHEIHRKAETALDWQHRCGPQQIWSHHRGSNTQSSKPPTMEEICMAARARNFCITKTLKKKRTFCFCLSQ